MTNVELRAAESLGNLHKDLSQVSERIKKISAVNEQQFFLDLSRDIAGALISKYDSSAAILSRITSLTNAIYDEVMAAYNKRFHPETSKDDYE